MGKGKKTRYGMEVPFRTLQHLLQEMEPDLVRNTSKRFCFVLGAGASRASGIPSGQNLVDQWDEYIRERDSTEEYEGWQREMGIRSKQDQYAHYSDYYQKRFEEDEADGPTFIRNVTAQAEPSAGYLALANVMTETANNIVLTTNFDKLVETSIFRDTAQIPWVIGTARELPYLDLNANYPKILKVHGDIFLDMRNTTEEIQELDSGWKEPLKDVLKTYHPVFIGYAGNDPGLMGYLESVAGQIKQPYWLYYREDELTERIWKFVVNSGGCFVDGRIGFDGILMHMFDRFHFQKAYMEQAKEREQVFQAKWQEAKDALTKLLADETESRKDQDLSDDNSMRESVAQIIGREMPEIWLYNLWNYRPEEQKRLLDAALVKFPKSAYVLGSYALYWKDQHEMDEAEKYYLNAIEADPKNARNLGNYANFLYEQRRYYDKAEEYYQRAIEADPKNADQLGNYANFLWKQRQDYDKAEEYYQRAIEANPKDADHLGNYAVFLKKQRQDYDKAEAYYQRAIEADPKNADHLGNYANFLWKQRQDYDKAEKYYQRAIEADPKDANNLGNYATFLWKQRQDYDKAEEYYQRAIEADPKHANNLGNYATFLWKHRQDYDKAEKYYQRAIKADPKRANNLGNYANFLCDQRQDYDKAEEYYQRAIEADPKHANNLGNYATFLWKHRQDYDKAEEYYQRAIEADPKNAEVLENYAVFLYEQRHDYDKTEEYLQKALAVDPDCITNLENYAEYLEDVCHDAKAAQEYRQRAEKLRTEQDKIAPSDENE